MHSYVVPKYHQGYVRPFQLETTKDNFQECMPSKEGFALRHINALAYKKYKFQQLRPYCSTKQKESIAQKYQTLKSQHDELVIKYQVESNNKLKKLTELEQDSKHLLSMRAKQVEDLQSQLQTVLAENAKLRQLVYSCSQGKVANERIRIIEEDKKNVEEKFYEANKKVQNLENSLQEAYLRLAENNRQQPEDQGKIMALREEVAVLQGIIQQKDREQLRQKSAAAIMRKELQELKEMIQRISRQDKTCMKCRLIQNRKQDLENSVSILRDEMVRERVTSTKKERKLTQQLEEKGVEVYSLHQQAKHLRRNLNEVCLNYDIPRKQPRKIKDRISRKCQTLTYIDY